MKGRLSAAAVLALALVVAPFVVGSALGVLLAHALQEDARAEP